MTSRQRLHLLVSELPESEIPTAERVLIALSETAARSFSLAEAPFDEEPDRDDEDGGLTEARAEAERGGGVPTDELVRRLGLR